LVRGRTSCADEEIKEKDYRRRIFHGPRRRCATKLCATIWGIPAPPSYYGVVPMQAWGSGAAMPPPFAVPNVAFAEPFAHLPQPQQNVAIIGGYAARKHANYCSHPNQCKPNG
jgi:hypothetical protein